MDTKELLKKVRKIEIKTRRLSDHVFGGEYHSTFKGRGMTFSEVRQYQFGDDVRAIDWNVTARYNEPFVKVFEEERELTLMLVVDVSGSEFFGTGNQFKREVLTEIAATLSFSAHCGFSSPLERFGPESAQRDCSGHSSRQWEESLARRLVSHQLLRGWIGAATKLKHSRRS